MSEGRLGAPVGGKDIAPVWRWLFWLAAIVNVVIGLGAMLSPVPDTDGRMIGLLILCLGVVYVLVAREPQRYAPVLWAGVIAKLGVAALLAPVAFGDAGSALNAGLVIVYGVLALGFLAFLFSRDDYTPDL